MRPKPLETDYGRDLQARAFFDRACPEPNTGCWLWTGPASGHGYGHVQFLGRRVYAHRLAFFLTHGRWPRPECMHTCDARACVNPDHLREGTHLENMRDMFAKGRRKTVAPKGEAVHTAKLTAGDVVEIRSMLSSGEFTHRQVAARFGVVRTTITWIAKGKSWKSVR